MEKKRLCSSCGKELLESDFYSSQRGGRCKSCKKLYKEDTRIRAWALDTLKNHRKKGYEVLITVKQLEELALETTHCKWCGRELQWKRFLGYTSAIPTVDRINNERHLGIDNVDIICHNCNSAKGKLSEDEFKNLIKQMYEVTILGSKGKD